MLDSNDNQYLLGHSDVNELDVPPIHRKIRGNKRKISSDDEEVTNEDDSNQVPNSSCGVQAGALDACNFRKSLVSRYISQTVHRPIGYALQIYAETLSNMPYYTCLLYATDAHVYMALFLLTCGLTDKEIEIHISTIAMCYFIAFFVFVFLHHCQSLPQSVLHLRIILRHRRPELAIQNVLFRFVCHRHQKFSQKCQVLPGTHSLTQVLYMFIRIIDHQIMDKSLLHFTY